jgi:hypothetical protein
MYDHPKDPGKAMDQDICIGFGVQGSWVVKVKDKSVESTKNVRKGAAHKSHGEQAHLVEEGAKLRLMSFVDRSLTGRKLETAPI